MRECYICARREERPPKRMGDSLPVIPICAICAKIYDIPEMSSSRRITIEMPQVDLSDDHQYVDFSPDPTPPY